MVRAGKAIYAGISNYNPEQTARAVEILRKLGTPPPFATEPALYHPR
jgi:L-glyceraldehyde 3-phosphate reductase